MHKNMFMSKPLLISHSQNIKQPLYCFVYIYPTQNIKQPLFCFFISPSQYIKQPLFCFVYISFTKYEATFVLFCLYLLQKILSNHCFVLFISPSQNLK